MLCYESLLLEHSYKAFYHSTLHKEHYRNAHIRLSTATSDLITVPLYIAPPSHYTPKVHRQFLRTETSSHNSAFAYK